MSFRRTMVVRTNALDQLLGREQAVGFNHGALAMHPLGFNGIEPRALCGQKQGQNAHAFTRGFDLLVVFTNPGAHDLTAMPGGIIPDQQPRAFSLGLQFGTAAGQKLRRDVTHRAPIDKPQGHLISNGGISRTSLPQDPITSQRFRIGIGLLPPLLDKANWFLLDLPGRRFGQRKATPPDLVEEANGPVDRLFLLRGQLNNRSRALFFPGTADRDW
jgi:hypothetical protein